jgi:hypothetical protein
LTVTSKNIHSQNTKKLPVTSILSTSLSFFHIPGTVPAFLNELHINRQFFNRENMKKTYFVLAAACLLIISTIAYAESGDVRIGVKGGTLGVGLEAGVDLSSYFGLRAGINYLKFDFDTTISNIDYNFEPEFFNGNLLLDLHPFSNSFRLTGGAYLNNNKVDVSGTYRKDLIPPEYDRFSNLVDLAQVKGSVDFNSIAPYVGIGWTSNQDGPGWGVDVDLGVMFQGSPSVNELYLDDPWGLGDTDLAKRLLEDERKAIEDELDKFQYYPVASIAVTYKF